MLPVDINQIQKIHDCLPSGQAFVFDLILKRNYEQFKKKNSYNS